MMKIKLDDNKKGIIAIAALGALFLLTLAMLFFCKLIDASGLKYLSRSPGEEYFFMGLICLVLAIVCFVGTAFAIGNYFIFKKNRFSRLKKGALVNFICAAVFSAFSIVTYLVSKQGNLVSLILLIFATLFFVFIRLMAAEPEISKKKQSPITARQLKRNIVSSGQTIVSIITVSATILALIINSIVLLFTPLFSSGGESAAPTIMSILNSLPNHTILEQTIAVIFIFLTFANFVFLVNVILKFVINTVKFLKSAKDFAKYNIFLALFIFAYSVAKFFMAKFKGEPAEFYTYINLITAVIIYIVFTVFAGYAEKINLLKYYPKLAKKKKQVKTSPLPMIFLLAMTGATLSVLFTKLFTLDIDAPTSAPIHEGATGFELIFKSNGSFQNIVAIVLIITCALSALFFILTLLNFIIDADNYKQSALSYAYYNLFFQFFFFVVGLFFVLMVPSFDSLFQAVFGDLFETLTGQEATISEYIKVTTQSFLPVLIGFTIFVLMQLFCFGRKSKAKELEAKREKENGTADEQDTSTDLAEEEPAEAEKTPAQEQVPEIAEEENIVLDDPCPAFSELDNNLPLYKNQLKERKTAVFENLTLESLTDFIIEFAKNTPERLSYSKDSISTFVAGLGASRLSILQGMSGTGKTSLPKVFMQAINGNCEIVEVESSWRDKNELLGYYNEFSKKYTPKKFTQFLYKAKLNSTVPTFIILDEMNLSRIEYYFSDFLSLMETRENLRAIKLLDIQLFPPKIKAAKVPPPQNSSSNTSFKAFTDPVSAVNTFTDGTDNVQKQEPVKPVQTADEPENNEYLGLSEGHTIKVPTNVWFIGTANRDESTFEISDKVYDRAQTMNFDSRAPKIMSEVEYVAPRFIEYSQLSQLFEEAKTAEFNAEAHPLIMAVEKLLAPYKISFGNRVLKQIEDFVKIYLKCNDISTEAKYNQVLSRAIENILFSKVVRKLELKIIENKAHLIESFEALNFKRCASFVSSLSDN